MADPYYLMSMSDIHIRDNADNFKAALEELKRRNTTVGPTAGLVMGDLYDRRPKRKLIKETARLRKEYKDAVLYYLLGNHDTDLQKEIVRTLGAKALHLGKEPHTLPDGTRIGGIDYIAPYPDLKPYNPKDYDLMLIHQAIKNDKGGGRQVPWALNVDDIPFKATATGDMHRRFILRNKLGNNVYAVPAWKGDNPPGVPPYSVFKCNNGDVTRLL